MSALFLALLLAPLASCNAITAAPALRPALLRRQSAAITGPATSCEPWLNFENSCAAATSDFTLLTDFASQAPCLCYTSSTWAPDAYDSALATCLSYFSTASPEYYTSSLNGPNLPRTPCLEVASIIGPGVSGVTSSPASASASSDPNLSACLSFESISSSCDAQIPGFATEAISAEENCLCFTSGTYAPSIFDGYWSSCLNYYSTASPEIYSSSLGGDAGVRSPCALFVPTAAGTASTALPTTAAATTTMASSGAGVTSIGPTSTSIPLTTAAATTKSSPSGNSGAVSGNGGSMMGLLFLGILAIAVVL
jgi:hypothetical protein